MCIFRYPARFKNVLFDLLALQIIVTFFIKPDLADITHLLGAITGSYCALFVQGFSVTHKVHPGSNRTLTLVNTFFVVVSIGSFVWALHNWRPMRCPLGIIRGNDGMWFAEQRANKIGRIAQDGTVTEIPIPTPHSMPTGIAIGPDGNVWFTEYNGNKIGRIKTDGTFTLTEFPLPNANSAPYQITAGPDGNLWFTESIGNRIGQIRTDGTIMEIAIRKKNSHPSGITAGPDGNIWFTEAAANAIGRVNLAKTPYTITEFALPTSNSIPSGITAGPDSALWFTESETGRIGRLSLDDLSITEFSLPHKGDPTQITSFHSTATNSTDMLWFAEPDANKIGFITTTSDHTIHELYKLSDDSGPQGITVGFDNTVWFTESNADKIGCIDYRRHCLSGPNPV